MTIATPWVSPSKEELKIIVDLDNGKLTGMGDSTVYAFSTACALIISWFVWDVPYIKAHPGVFASEIILCLYMYMQCILETIRDVARGTIPDQALLKC